MYIATGAQKSMRSPMVKTMTEGVENGPGLWHVFAQHHRKSDREFITDVFVFDAATGTMHEAMLGIQYARVSKESMSKMLTRLTTDPLVLVKGTRQSSTATSATLATQSINTGANGTTTPMPAASSPSHIAEVVPSKPLRNKDSSKEKKTLQAAKLTDQVRDLVSSVSGIDAAEFTLDTEMADLGIDSLMGMELAREVELVLKCTISQAEQMEATTLRKFVVCVSNALDRAGMAATVGSDTGGDSDDDEASFFSGDKGDTDSKSSLGHVDARLWTPNKQDNQLADDKAATASNLTLSRADIIKSFGEVKMLTDELILTHHLDTIHKTEIAGSNRLCTALVVEAMEKMGMSLRGAAPGQELERVAFLPQHRRLMDWVYKFLEDDARLINQDIASGRLVRTHIPTPRQTSQAVFEDLLDTHPGFAVPNRITYHAGQSLADVLSGQTDGIRVIFGTPAGRKYVQAMYCEHTFNHMNYLQMRDVIRRLVDCIGDAQPGETLRILEMGAGTGGTTMVLAPFLAGLDIPVEYTFTDLSSSMVANARRSFGPKYPFMRFAVHDIEKAPGVEHKGQHIILASNAVHATRNLATSARNIRQALRPDGFLMILEMTEVVPFVDLVFGLLEGWWLFDDGRSHAIVTAEHWERELHAAGYGHVDWTDGSLPENALQKVIVALASGPPEAARLPKAAAFGVTRNVIGLDSGDVTARKAEAESLVSMYTRGWATPALVAIPSQVMNSVNPSNPAVVMVTGATGSLGAHLVQNLAEHKHVRTVVCINRHSSKPVGERQADAFSLRGIDLSPSARAKLHVLETDTSRPQLGLLSQEYNWLLENVTHIIHNAWPMSGTRPLKAFEPQLQALRNLLDLARDMATYPNKRRTRIGFQFVSSIGVVGNVGTPRALEQRHPQKRRSK
ncbi:hypothetical protein NUW58_g3530 [Xylaria curta]|uniref:Uncharacterized protein n=1 Tax=Xylaria curta TaxID=42375 RepID=A0ACC1PAL1_9PEZI|nr:hypothetical protein NUW58_g3530 [Xylaria curta]